MGSEAAFISSRSRGTLAAEHERTLVVYFLSNSDPIYQSNLNYFVRTAVAATDACDYVFVIQGIESPQVRFYGAASKFSSVHPRHSAIDC